MKKLVFVINSLKMGGAERVASILATNLSSQYDLSFVLMGGGDGEQLTYTVPNDVFYLNLEEVSVSPVHSILMAFKKIFYLRAVLNSIKPDAVVSFSLKENCISIVATWLSSIKVYVCEHTHPAYSKKFGAFWNRLRVYLYRYSDGVVVLTPDIENWMNRHCKCLARVIANPVESLPFRKIQSKVCHELIAIGRLSHEKGFRRLIDVAGVLDSMDIEFRLNIFGEGAEFKELTRHINDLNLAGKVKLMGVVDDVEERLRKSDLLLCTSLYEGFPMVICEAMSVGVPVVAFNVPGVRDLIRDNDNGVLVEDGNLIGLATQVSVLMGDYKRRERLVLAGNQSMEEYSLDKVLACWVSLLDE